jgi:hypothetical protein
MRYSIEFIRSLIVSPEFLVLSLTWAGAILFEEEFRAIGSFLKSLDKTLLLGVSSLPTVALVANYKLCWEFLNPTRGRDLLISWPDYPLLRQTVLVALVYSLLSCVMGYVAMYITFRDWLVMAGALALASIALAGISIASVAWNRFILRDILDERLKH